MCTKKYIGYIESKTTQQWVINPKPSKIKYNYVNEMKPSWKGCKWKWTYTTHEYKKKNFTHRLLLFFAYSFPWSFLYFLIFFLFFSEWMIKPALTAMLRHLAKNTTRACLHNMKWNNNKKRYQKSVERLTWKVMVISNRVVKRDTLQRCKS